VPLGHTSQKYAATYPKNIAAQVCFVLVNSLIYSSLLFLEILLNPTPTQNLGLKHGRPQTHGCPQTFFQGRAKFSRGGGKSYYLPRKCPKTQYFLSKKSKTWGGVYHLALPCGHPWRKLEMSYQNVLCSILIAQPLAHSYVFITID